jgi:hypothetical protein
MPGGSEESSLYKVVTLVVSVVSVIVIAAQGIYDHYYTERWKQIEYLSNQLNEQRAELIREESKPKLEVWINTLESAGLSTQLLSSLNAFPSTIEIRNTGSATARGVVLDLSSSERITTFQQWPTTEPMSVIRPDNGRNSLRVEVPLIRKGSRVDLTILTPKLPKIASQTVVDLGDIVNASTESVAQSQTSAYLRIAPEGLQGFRFKDWFELEKELENEKDPVKRRIKILEKQIGNLRNQSFWNFVSEGDFLPYLLLTIFVAGGVGFVLYSLRKDSRKRRTRKNILSEIRDSSFRRRTLAGC